MLNDDLNRNDLNRDNMRLNQDPLTPNDRYEGMSSGWMMLIAAVAVMAVLFMWAPWSGPRVADNTAPGTTTGSSTDQFLRLLRPPRRRPLRLHLRQPDKETAARREGF